MCKVGRGISVGFGLEYSTEESGGWVVGQVLYKFNLAIFSSHRVRPKYHPPLIPVITEPAPLMMPRKTFHSADNITTLSHPANHQNPPN